MCETPYRHYFISLGGTVSSFPFDWWGNTDPKTSNKLPKVTGLVSNGAIIYPRPDLRPSSQQLWYIAIMCLFLFLPKCWFVPWGLGSLYIYYRYIITIRGKVSGRVTAEGKIETHIISINVHTWTTFPKSRPLLSSSINLFFFQ